MFDKTACLDINLLPIPTLLCLQLQVPVSSPCYRSLDCLHYVINLGCDTNLRDGIGRTPIHYAAANNLLPFIRLLVETDADINVADNNGSTALMLAAASDKDGRSVSPPILPACPFQIPFS